MEQIFVDLPSQSLEEAGRTLSGLVPATLKEGDSANALGGTYYSLSVFGMKLRLEENAYDYEDSFRYMLAIKRDPSSSIVVEDPAIKDFCRFLARLLADNLATEVAIESRKGLEIIEQPSY